MLKKLLILTYNSLKLLKKEINFLFIIFLLSCFIPTTALFCGSLEDTSMEHGAIQKHRGLEEQEKDSPFIIRQKLIKNIEMGNIEKIKLFIKNNGKNINFINKGVNPFTYTASINNLELLKFFLNETGIDIDVVDEFGNTALINASGKGHLEIVDYLIKNGADVNYQNKQGLTPAMKAAERNNFYVIKLLLDKNIDISKSDYSGRTLREIAENNRDKRILKLLN